MKTPEILSEKAPDREPASMREVVTAYLTALDASQLKRDILRRQIEDQKTERATA
ncbi:MAG: hypothetical protein PHE68_03760 [Candidatus Peribacteraceae bacterium]|nr:hypothetical protein [Candidatus Peribacteraceae bacterium]MDD5075179.1 hypothetical protein [Candidatus Peribacteraceae bacterium]